MQEVVGGQLVHEIISEEEGVYFNKETVEAFFTIQWEIKNKQNLQEALEGYI